MNEKKKIHIKECCICLEPLIHKFTELPCKHQLHTKCLHDYENFKFKNTLKFIRPKKIYFNYYCPMCRNRYTRKTPLNIRNIKLKKNIYDRFKYVIFTKILRRRN